MASEDRLKSNELDQDYKLLCLIGRGAYGEVWLAEDRAGNHWAVKIVYRVSFDDDKPFRRELDGIRKFVPISRISAAQMHVVHVGESKTLGCFYYIMELADDASGAARIEADTYQPHTLRHELRTRHRIPARETVGIAWSLSHALECLHAHGMVHRDIKPGNIIFVGGRPKLADVGLVTRVDKSLTFAGTEGYLPPEGPGSFQADIYALGITLYETCTGCDRRDFPCLPEELGGFADHAELLELMRIINRACEPNLRRRYRTAGMLRRDLERLLVARSSSPGRKVLGVSGALLAVVLVALGVAWWKPWRFASSGAPLLEAGSVEVQGQSGLMATGVVDGGLTQTVALVEPPKTNGMVGATRLAGVEAVPGPPPVRLLGVREVHAANPEFEASVAAIRRELEIAAKKLHLASVTRVRWQWKFDRAHKPAPRIRGALDAAIAEEEAWRLRVMELNARLRSIEQ